MILTERISPHIIRARIDRPESMNAVNFAVVDELEELIGTIEADEDIRVLIFSGTGNDSFIAGGDLREFHSIKSEEEAADMSQRIHRLFLRIEQLPCWNIAFINGPAYGGGVELMLAFDFRLSRPGNKFGMTQGRFYLTPGWGGLSRLVEKVGRSTALKWLGKAEIIDTETALSHGLIDEVLENATEEGLQDWAKALTLNDRHFIRTLKEGSFRFSKSREAALQAEIEPFSRLWVDEQHLQRVEDFLNRDRT